MDDTSILAQILKSEKSTLIAIAYLIYKYGNIGVKKLKGDYVSYKDISKDLSELKAKFGMHIMSSDRNLIDLEKLKSTQIEINSNFKENIKRIDDEMERRRQTEINIFSKIDKIYEWMVAHGGN